MTINGIIVRCTNVDGSASVTQRKGTAPALRCPSCGRVFFGAWSVSEAACPDCTSAVAWSADCATCGAGPDDACPCTTETP
jgi:hypothetical protein